MKSPWISLLTSFSYSYSVYWVTGICVCTRTSFWRTFGQQEWFANISCIVLVEFQLKETDSFGMLQAFKSPIYSWINCKHSGSQSCCSARLICQTNGNFPSSVMVSSLSCKRERIQIKHRDSRYITFQNHEFNATGPVLTDSWSTSTEKAQCSGRAAAYLWHAPGHAPGHVPWLWPGQWSWHRPAVSPRHWAWLTARGATLTSNAVWRCYMMSSVLFASGLILAEIYWQKTNSLLSFKIVHQCSFINDTEWLHET